MINKLITFIFCIQLYNFVLSHFTLIHMFFAKSNRDQLKAYCFRELFVFELQLRRIKISVLNVYFKMVD